jgi:hypothetical protein
MRWYQGSDPHIGTPGFLCFHRQVRYFLTIEDLKKMEKSWREMEEFAQFSKKLLTMNPTQKKLKEDMASSFLRKMSSQVKKHNKRYLLTKHLVKGVFAGCETGQAVAQFFKGSDEAMPALSEHFFSKQHDQEIGCRKFLQFLHDEIPLAVLDELRTNPAVQLNREAIDQIAVGLDIWDETRSSTNEHAYLLRSQALCSFAAHASTQHNNERLVKLGALIASTGKSEILASIFAITSNDFITGHHDDEGEDTADLETTANQPAVAEDKPKQRKRGKYQGKKKLLDLEREMVKKSKQLAAIATNLGAQTYNTRMNANATSLKSKADNLLERSSDLKVRMMMASFDMPDKQANARQRKRGEDMPPRLLGYFPYVPVGRTINIGELEKKSRTPNVTFEPTLKVTKKCKLLEKDELRRCEEAVNADLTSRGYEFQGLKMPAKLQLVRQDITEKEDSTNGEYEIDTAKYFKLLWPDVNKTIFEDE